MTSTTTKRNLLLTVFVLLCTLATTSPAHAQDNTVPGEPLVYTGLDLKYPGVTYLDVPPSWPRETPFTSATLYIDTLYLYEYLFMLSGRVLYGNRVRPVQITATFFDSILNTNDPDKSATAFDATGNFYVAHVSVRSNPPDYMFITSSESPLQGSKGVLMIYLQRPDGPIPWQVENREITLFEIPTEGTPLEEFTAPLLERTDLPPSPFLNDHWYVLLIRSESSFSVDSYQSTEYTGCLWGYKIASDPTIVELDLEFGRDTPDVRGYQLLTALSNWTGNDFLTPMQERGIWGCLYQPE